MPSRWVAAGVALAALGVFRRVIAFLANPATFKPLEVAANVVPWAEFGSLIVYIIYILSKAMRSG